MAIEKKIFPLRISSYHAVGVDLVTASSAPSTLNLNSGAMDRKQLTESLFDTVDGLLLNSNQGIVRKIFIRLENKTIISPIDYYLDDGIPDGLHELCVEMITSN